MTTKSNVFKMRCETTDDAFRFLTDFFNHTDGERNHIQMDKDGYCGCEITLTTVNTIEYLKMIIKSIPDLYTMYETIQPIETYTGIRNIKI